MSYSNLKRLTSKFKVGDTVILYRAINDEDRKEIEEDIDSSYSCWIEGHMDKLIGYTFCITNIRNDWNPIEVKPIDKKNTPYWKYIFIPQVFAKCSVTE